jgi:hypothetical protein
MGTNDDEALRRRLDGCSRTSDSGDEGRLTEFVAPQ